MGADRRQIVCDGTDGLACKTPVKRQAYLMQSASVYMERLNAMRHKCARLDGSAGIPCDHPIAVFNAPLSCQFGADLVEHARLQLIEPAIEATHRATQIVLGEAIGCGHDRKLGVRRIVRIEWNIEPLHRGTLALLGIEQIWHR